MSTLSRFIVGAARLMLVRREMRYSTMQTGYRSARIQSCYCAPTVCFWAPDTCASSSPSGRLRAYRGGRSDHWIIKKPFRRLLPKLVNPDW